jgi:hypothetical protein
MIEKSIMKESNSFPPPAVNKEKLFSTRCKVEDGLLKTADELGCECLSVCDFWLYEVVLIFS